MKNKNALVPINQLPPDAQSKINKLAIIDIYKDEAKQKIKADSTDINYYIDTWIKTKRSKYTRIFYAREIKAFREWCDSIGRNPILCTAHDVDNYIIFLGQKYKNNSVRQKIWICSSFYSALSRYGVIQSNPFNNCPIPRKEYKKAREGSFVMTAGELLTITVEARQSAPWLIPVIFFLSTYGLRIGALFTVEIEKKYFTVVEKGNRQRRIPLLPGSKKVISGNKPFEKLVRITVQVAIKRITKRLFMSGKIRQAYSCHDFRHYFAAELYKSTRDIVGVKNALGHSSLATTDIYLQGIGVMK